MLARSPIRGDLQARVPVPRPAKQPPAPAPSSLPVRTTGESDASVVRNDRTRIGVAEGMLRRRPGQVQVGLRLPVWNWLSSHASTAKQRCPSSFNAQAAGCTSASPRAFSSVAVLLLAAGEQLSRSPWPSQSVVRGGGQRYAGRLLLLADLTADAPSSAVTGRGRGCNYWQGGALGASAIHGCSGDAFGECQRVVGVS